MGHYQLFREFQSLANALLETVISDLGGSLEQFVKAADDVLARGTINTFSLYICFSHIIPTSQSPLCYQ